MSKHIICAAFVLLGCQRATRAEAPAAAAARQASELQSKAPLPTGVASSPPARETPPEPKLPPVVVKAHPSRTPAIVEAFRVPPPWPEEWCVSHDAVWDAELQGKYFPEGTEMDFSWGCGWGIGGKVAGKDLGLGLRVGRRTVSSPDNYREKARRDPMFPLPLHVFDNGEVTVLRIWNNDPPFVVAAEAEGDTRPERERLARALLKDFLPRLTPAALSHPRAELTVAYPDHPDKARATLAQWSRLKYAFDAAMPLAPGFPRMVKTEDFKWDPAHSPGAGREFLLLGICPPGAGKMLMDRVGGTFPLPPDLYGVAYYIADAAGLSVQCPCAAVHGEEHHTVVGWLQEDGWALSVLPVIELKSKPGEVVVYGSAILYNPEGVMVEYAPFEMRKPQDLKGVPGRYGHTNQRRKVGKCDYSDSNTTIRVVCESVWSDNPCRVPEYEGSRLEFRMSKDHKIEIESTPETLPGRDCSIPE